MGDQVKQAGKEDYVCKECPCHKHCFFADRDSRAVYLSAEPQTNLYPKHGKGDQNTGNPQLVECCHLPTFLP